MGTAVRVSLVEDELMLRRMLEQLLHSRPGVALVHSVGGFQEARLVMTPGSTDVAIVDVQLGDGDGVALGARLQRADPDVGVLLLSCHDAMPAFLLAQETATKPWSYLSKRSSFAITTLTRAIAAAAAGEQVVDPYLVERSSARSDTQVSRLSPAQFRVLALVSQGRTNDWIAGELGIAVRSVENHLLAVYRILGLDSDGHNRRVLATLAFLQQTSRYPAT
ncbi:response regulator transcription factor [Cellulomonas triticagri]|uniref:DNA-binding response regulator n=1 Tax=Cellulomonas triticagri TaxID=2483352 RepID=A0A3M2JP09_9CELL|nr:response regulator [Cellulomonas triticagri]RMI14051.1 DNA-binding response regulator [Cellulomonas triticagri]